MLKLLGVPLALAASPLAAAALLAGVASHPTLVVVTVAEVLRKVCLDKEHASMHHPVHGATLTYMHQCAA